MTKLTEQQRELITRWARAKYNCYDAMIRTVEHGRYLDVILPAGSPAEVLALAEAWQAERQADVKANVEQLNAPDADWEMINAHHAAQGVPMPDGWTWQYGRPLQHGKPRTGEYNRLLRAARCWQRGAGASK